MKHVIDYVITLQRKRRYKDSTRQNCQTLVIAKIIRNHKMAIAFLNWQVSNIGPMVTNLNG